MGNGHTGSIKEEETPKTSPQVENKKIKQPQKTVDESPAPKEVPQDNSGSVRVDAIKKANRGAGFSRIPDEMNEQLFDEKTFGPILCISDASGRLYPDWTIFEEDTGAPSFYFVFSRRMGDCRRIMTVKEIAESYSKYRAGEVENKQIDHDYFGPPVDPEQYLQELHEYLRYAKNTYRFIDRDGEMCRLYETPSWHTLKKPRVIVSSLKKPRQNSGRNDEQKNGTVYGKNSVKDFNPAEFYVASKFEPAPILKGGPAVQRYGSQGNIRYEGYDYPTSPGSAAATSPKPLRSRVSFTKDVEYHHKTKFGFNNSGGDDDQEQDN